MTTHFVLVDFENVQPKSLGALSPDGAHVRIFAGASQSKVDLGLAQALQPFGTKAEYIQIVGKGKDALDFHIAFYVGELAARHPNSRFTIVSKDAGFDPLIKHLAARGIQCQRVGALSGGAVTRSAAPKPSSKKPPAVIPAPSAQAGKKREVCDRLKGLKAARPRTLKTLSSSLKAWFKPALTDAAVNSLLAELQADGIVTVSGAKVSYTL